MKALKKLFQTIVFLALLAGLGYFFRNDLTWSWRNFNKIISPCDQQISYSIGEFDQRFGMSQKELLRAIGQAARIWQEPVGKPLFSYAPGGGLKINLIYDARQDASHKLKKLGLTIKTDQSTYQNLKSKYDDYNQTYQRQRAELDSVINYYNEQKANYEDEVKAANRRGGATPDEITIFTEEKQELDNLIAKIKQKQTAINQTIDDLNALANVINRLIRQLNLKVGDYNTIGADSSGQFQEGQFTSDASGEKIDIYQFDDREMLVRVLAHELGHALGLEHLNNPQAIMYYLNESGNNQITADDLSELKRVCKIK